MAFIEFERVVKHYPGAAGPAVQELNLSIEPGEFLTLLGPSGSGKTTTLMMLAGFEAVSSGHIRLDGQPIDRLPAHERGMGVVFQSYSLFPHLSVAENVAFPLRVRKRPAAEIARRVQRSLALVHLEAFAERRPRQLSGGQQQRVALARALVFEPRLVLMDEPLAALDKRLREEMQLEIRRLHREVGVTMVYVTHDQGEAMTLSDRVAVFNQGRIEQLGTPAQLYDAPANAFVAGFIGDNNRIEAPLVGALAPLAPLAPLAAMAARGAASAVSRKAIVCVRPERLRLAGPAADEGAGDQGDASLCRIKASVLDLIHQGDHWRMIARLADAGLGEAVAEPWVVKLGHDAPREGLAPGRAIELQFRAEDAWVF